MPQKPAPGGSFARGSYIKNFKPGAVSERVLQPAAPLSVQAYISRGLLCIDGGMIAEALAEFSTAIQLDRRSRLAYFNRGNAYRKMGRLDKAITDYDNLKVGAKICAGLPPPCGCLL